MIDRLEDYGIFFHTPPHAQLILFGLIDKWISFGGVLQRQELIKHW